MRTIELLTGPQAAFFWPGILTGFLLAAICSVLSVLVVLKRMAFIGQGVSHAAFGGLGLVGVLGLAAGMGAGAGEHLLQFLLIGAFCVAAAIVIGLLSERGATDTDTAIGIVLVATMAAGVLLAHIAMKLDRPRLPGWESILFGSMAAVGWTDLAMTAVTGAILLALLFYARRPMIFWAFEQQAAAAFGVRTGRMKYLLIIMLALAIVLAMKLVGVVLATALLVLPGAAALRLSRQLRTVFASSVVVGLAGVAGGLVLSFEADWPPGASIVLVLTLLYALARTYDVVTLARARGAERTA